MNNSQFGYFVRRMRSRGSLKRVAGFLSVLTTIFLSGLVAPQVLLAAPGDITTIAGGGVGDTGSAASASLYLPRGIHVTASGVIYLADTLNHRVRKIDTNGIITTIAGNGIKGFSGDGGLATAASLNYPMGVAADSAGNIYIADAHNHRVRKVSTSGIITTTIGGGAENAADYCSLAATDIGSIFPRNIFLDSSDRVHITDGQLWRLETDGTLINLSDTSCGYGALEPGFSSGFFNASGAFIYASGNNIFRTSDMQTSTLLGAFSPVSPGGFTTLSGDASGNIYVASSYTNIVYKFDTAGASTVYAGTGAAGYSGDGGDAVSANISNPTDVSVDASGNVYVVDRMNHRIRKVDLNGTITTVAGTGEAGFAGDGLAATSERLNLPRGVFVDSAGNVFVADTSNHRVRKIDTAGIVTTIAGNGVADFSGDGGPASAASLHYPTGIFVHSDGTIYIADSFNDRIRKIDPTGTITTIAGTEDTGYDGDGGPATLAVLNYPTGVLMDGSGNIFIADLGNNAIRRIDTSGVISTYANIMRPRSIALDSSGVLYVATNYDGINRVYPGGMVDLMPSCTDSVGVSVDSENVVYVACQSSHTIIKAVPGMAAQTIAGTGSEGFSGDNGPAIAAKLASPSSVFVDFTGAIYIADSGNNRIRRMAGQLEPSVLIQSPPAGSTNSTTPLLSYIVSSGTAVVKIDGIVVNKVSGNNLDPLADGLHTVRVDVTNEFGTGYAERTFIVDTVIPTVTISSPASGTTTDNQPLLTYTVSEGVVTVKVDGGVVNKISGNRLEMLSNGTHIVRVESRDTAGNIGFAEVTFTVEAPPTVTISSPSAGVTNNSAPLLTYTVTSGTAVVKVDGMVVNKASGDNLDPLADGPHTVRVEATNANGTGYAERTFTVDTAAPTVVITSPTVGTTADNQPLLTYSVSDGTVTVKVDSVVVNKVSSSRLSVLSNGPHTVRVESMDAAGNIGFDEVAFAVDAPIERIAEDFESGDLGKLPWITSGNGAWTVKSTVKHGGLYAAEAPQSIGDSQSASLEVSRTTASDSISFWYSVSSETNYDFLKFYVDGVQKGQWSGTVPWTHASYTVSAGTHTFKWVYSKDVSVSTGSDTAWIDDIVFPLPPPAPTVTITSPAASITNSSTPVLAYAVSGGTVVVKIDNAVISKVSGEMLDSLSDGTHALRVEATDANGTGFAEKTFTVDTIAPTVVINSPIAGAINTKSPALTYTVSDGSISVKVDGNVVSKVSGTTLDPLPDGTHTLRVESTDGAGNTGFAEIVFTVDTTAPTVSIASPISGATNNNHPVVTYTVSDGTVVVTVDGVVVAKVSGDALDALADGSHKVRAESTDSVGNVGFAEVTFVVDTVPPTVTVNPLTTPTRVNTQTIGGNRESGATITLSVDTSAPVGPVVYPTDTTWSGSVNGLAEGTNNITITAKDRAQNTTIITTSILYDSIAPSVTINSPALGVTKDNTPRLDFTIMGGSVSLVRVDGVVVSKTSGQDLDALMDGSHTVRVEATDAAGNTGFAEVVFMVDTIAPAVSINPVTTPTNMSSQTLMGTREENATVSIAVNTSASVGTVSYPSATTWSCMVSNLATGNNSVTVTATDSAGNPATATTDITFDAIAPTVSISSPGSVPTNDNTPLLTYSASDGSVVVKVDGVVISKVSGDSLDMLTDGSHTVLVESTDAAGNVGSAQVSCIVDTVAPAILINPVTTPTKLTSQTISGTRESGASVSVTVNTSATVEPVSYGSGTTWSCTISGLVHGNNVITAQAVDAANNSTTATVTIRKN